jgi:hypothetical protein
MRGAGMKMQELVTLLSNKLSSLNNAKSTAVASGDVEAVIRLDVEIQETQVTLNTLQGAM